MTQRSGRQAIYAYLQLISHCCTAETSITLSRNYCCFLVSKSCQTLLWPQEAHQAPLAMGFPREEYWSRLPLPSLGIFPTQGWNPRLLHCRQIFFFFLPMRHQEGPKAIILQLKINVFKKILKVLATWNVNMKLSNSWVWYPEISFDIYLCSYSLYLKGDIYSD